MSTPSIVADTRAALADLLRAVSAVGVVHRVERYASSEDAFRAAYLYTHTDPAADAFGPDSHIRGWYIRRTGTAETTVNGRVMNEHTWLVRGYMSFKDAIESESIFDDLVERIRDAVRVNTALGLPGLIGAQPYQERGVQVTGAGPVIFAGVLCHSAALEFKTRSWVDWRKP